MEEIAGISPHLPIPCFMYIATSPELHNLVLYRWSDSTGHFYSFSMHCFFLFFSEFERSSETGMVTSPGRGPAYILPLIPKSSLEGIA